MASKEKLFNACSILHLERMFGTRLMENISNKKQKKTENNSTLLVYSQDAAAVF